jgi:hypothetical protein
MRNMNWDVLKVYAVGFIFSAFSSQQNLVFASGMFLLFLVYFGNDFLSLLLKRLSSEIILVEILDLVKDGILTFQLVDSHWVTGSHIEKLVDFGLQSLLLFLSLLLGEWLLLRVQHHNLGGL